MNIVRIAESVGLDAVQLYSVDLGHGNKPAEKELERYLRDLLEQVNIPARLSSHKAAGYNIPLPVIERLLADYPSIVAIHCIADGQYLRSVCELAAGRADVLTGGSLDGHRGFAGLQCLDQRFDCNGRGRRADVAQRPSRLRGQGCIRPLEPFR